MQLLLTSYLLSVHGHAWLDELSRIISITLWINCLPCLSAVFYPTVAGSYAPILFISGFKGVVYPAFYSTAISNLASYGYVVLSIDPYWPAEASKMKPHPLGGDHLMGRGGGSWEEERQDVDETNVEKTFELLQWVSVWL